MRYLIAGAISADAVNPLTAIEEEARAALLLM
jgi:hypothetical protein